MFPKEVYTGVQVVAYDPMQLGDWQQVLVGCEGVVNLAGEPIAEARWTPEQKQTILNSRVVTTQNLVEAMRQADPHPRVLVNASAIGFYGTSEVATFDESSSSGDDFLAQVCQQWEAAAKAAESRGTRVVILRLGIVLGPGGALAKMLPPFRMFAGGPIGTGRQWFSWIHRDDVVDLIVTALTDSSWQGIYNATAPHPVRMTELCKQLGRVLNRPSWLPVPSFALEALLGEGAKVVLEGQRVLPSQTLAAGFKYEYPDLPQALEQVLTIA
jgi:uncharacterized protein (TIGR01777 family)